MVFSLAELRNSKLYKTLQDITVNPSVLISLTPRLQFGGSGTLVKYKEFCGILTATHVMANNLNCNEIFTPIIQTDDPNLLLSKKITVKRVIYLENERGIQLLSDKNKAPWPEATLDICLIEVEIEIFNDMLKISGKKAIDLDIYKNKYLANPEYYTPSEPLSKWIWAIVGSPRTETKINTYGIVESPYSPLILCGGSVNGTTYKTTPLEHVKAPFDRTADLSTHDFGPTQDDFPTTFSGISGGGLWQISFYGKENTPEQISNILFVGICVAETPYCLHGRGPESLYSIFTEYLDALI